MKCIKTIVLLFIVLASTNIIFAGEKQADRTKSFSVSKGGTLVAKADPGNIIIESWDKNEVFIELAGSGHADLNDVSIEKRGNEIYLRSNQNSGWNKNIDYYVKVPKNFHLNLETSAGNLVINNELIGRASLYSSGGNVETDNVQGELLIRTMGGNITTKDITGRLAAETHGGNIRTGRLKGEPAELNTMGGSIEVISSESSLGVKTYGGEIMIGDIGGNAIIETYGGNINLKNVGGNVDAKTYGGNIKLESANGNVRVKTNGGNISLKDITGSVNAKTSAGNIYVELTPSSNGKSVIETSIGEIELQIPSSAEATIKAEIETYTKWEKDSYKIISDFNESKSNFDRNNKDIRKIFELNGGGHEIILNTTSSDIKIKKLK